MSLVDNETIIKYMEKFIPQNKLRGIISEVKLPLEIGLHGQLGEKKLLQGGWILSPKDNNFSLPRFLVFTTSTVYRTLEDLRLNIHQLENNISWQTLATFLNQSGIGVIVTGCYTDAKQIDFDNLNWQHFVYQNEHLIEKPNDFPFEDWAGNKGRPSRNNTLWDDEVKEEINRVDTETLVQIAIRQAFYQSYLKKYLKKPIIDPYDIDGFIVGFSGNVIPIEIKEKSVTDKGEFGIDAGRILMLLRLCLPKDNNALYIIREIDKNPSRSLIKWRYITLSGIITGCKWNLQGGGRGMQGGATQTIMLSENLFNPLTDEIFSEKWIHENNSLQHSLNISISDLENKLKTYFQ